MNKLYIGCGTQFLGGYIHADLRKTRPDVIEMDMRKKPWPWPDCHFDLIYNAHTMEHFYYWQIKEIVLPEFMRVLKLGGILRLSIPSLNRTWKEFGPNEHDLLLPGVLYGGGTWSKSTSYHDTHYFGWTDDQFYRMFVNWGFKDVRYWEVNEYPEIKALNDASSGPTSVGVEGKRVENQVINWERIL